MVTASANRVDVVARGRMAEALESAQAAVNRGCETKSVHVRTDWAAVASHHWGKATRTFVVGYLRDLASEPKPTPVKLLPGGTLRFLVFQDQEQPLPYESIAEYLAELGVRSPGRVHLARLEVDSAHSFLTRFLYALRPDRQDGAILDAWWDRDEFVAIAPSFRRLRVPAAALPGKIRGLSTAARDAFEIDPEGAFVYWPSRDVHLGWEQIEQLADPAAHLRAQQESDAFNQRYGAAIRHLREQAGLSQGGVAGLDERTVRRIEQGATRATAQALAKLAKAHGMKPNDYLNAIAKVLR